MFRKSTRLCIYSLFILIAFAVTFASMRNTVTCDPELQPYVNRFFAEAEKRNVQYDTFYLLNVTFSAILEPTTAGTSYVPTSNFNKLIRINSNVWKYLSEEGKTILVAHELGHSILHRSHVDNFMPDFKPASIMYYAMFDKEIYLANEKYYWDELFSVRNDL